LHHLSYRRRAALIAVFYAWLTQNLLPKVNSGAVIVMDNATFHKRKDMLEAIENCGCIPEFYHHTVQILTLLRRNGHKPNQSGENFVVLLMNYLLAH